MFQAFSRIWLINISLAVFVIFFGIKSFEVWSGGDETIPKIRTGKSPEKPPPRKIIMERTMPPELVYGIVVDKNLFSSNRAESIPEELKPGELKVSEKNIFLYGVVLMGDHKKALISNPEPGPEARERRAKCKWVKVGDTMGDFSVTDIRKDRIILAEGAKKHEILLYDKNKPARQITVAEKPKPTVVTAVTTEPAAAATKPDKELPIPGISERKSSSEGEYTIINTPFGPIKRRK